MARRSALLRNLLQMLVVAVAYFGAAELSLPAALVERNVTPVWPPTGIAVVAFLMFGPRMWPAIAAAAFLVNAPISSSALVAVAIAAGNTLAPLLAWFLLKRARFRPELERLRDAMAIVFLGALVATLVSATVGSTALAVSGAVGIETYGETWAVWWTGDAMGVLVFAPFLLSLWTHRRGTTSWLRRIEAAALFATLALVSYSVFRSEVHVQYLVFPILGWAAWRFEQRGAAPAALLASGIAVWAAVHGYGPFGPGGLLEKMVTLQLFNVGIAFTSFVFAAVITERRRARTALERAAVQLEHRVRQRTSELSAANEQLRHEVGERQRAEADLRRIGTLLARAEQIARIGSWEWDIRADAITWSDELFRIFGVPSRDFKATFDAFLRLVHPEDRDRVATTVRKALDDRRRSFELDHRIVRPGGEDCILRARGEVIMDDSGAPMRIVGTAQDVTDQRRAEDTLRRFIANASHELRTPLTAVSGLAKLLADKRRDLSEELFDECLDTLGQQGERARRLIEELLDLSRAEQGPEVMRTAPVKLAEATRRVLRAVSPPAETSVEVVIPEDLVVLADPGALERVLINLLTNAYNYGGSGVRIDAGEWNGDARIVVADDGGGVPPATIPHLFEPFSRGPVAPGTGSGLGLAIARSLVESIGGDIRYEPGVPHGARFVVTLPVPD